MQKLLVAFFVNGFRIILKGKIHRIEENVVKTLHNSYAQISFLAEKEADKVKRCSYKAIPSNNKLCSKNLG